MSNLEDDELYKLLLNGTATTEDQSNAAAWIAHQQSALKAFAEESADVAAPYDNHRLAILYDDGSASPLHLTVADLRVAALIFNPK